MKGDRCEFCEGNIEEKQVLARVRYRGQTIYVENVPAWVCSKCGEQYFDAPVYKRLEEIVHQRERIQKVITFPLAEFDMAIPGVREPPASYGSGADHNDGEQDGGARRSTKKRE